MLTPKVLVSETCDVSSTPLPPGKLPGLLTDGDAVHIMLSLNHNLKNGIYLHNPHFNQATGYASLSQHIWCLSQSRINWEGCARKGIRRKNTEDGRGEAPISQDEVAVHTDCLRKQEVGKPSQNAPQASARVQGCINHDLRADRLQKSWELHVDTWNGRAGEVVEAFSDRIVDVARIPET